MITLLWLLSLCGRAIKIDSSFKRFMPSLLLFLVFTHTSVEVCVETGHPIEVCDMKFAPKPLVDHILVPTVGVSEGVICKLGYNLIYKNYKSMSSIFCLICPYSKEHSPLTSRAKEYPRKRKLPKVFNF